MMRRPSICKTRELEQEVKGGLNEERTAARWLGLVWLSDVVSCAAVHAAVPGQVQDSNLCPYFVLVWTACASLYVHVIILLALSLTCSGSEQRGCGTHLRRTYTASW